MAQILVLSVGMRSTPLFVGLLILLVGCEGASTSLDGGAPAPDAAAQVADSGSQASADTGQPLPDAGSASADASSAPVDAGNDPDAGVPAPPRVGEPGFVRAWFSDYNVGQDQAYLQAGFRDEPAGDPRYTAVPSHRYVEDVAYGPFPRNRLDAWLLSGAGPHPVAVFIHGGGFVGGSRTQITDNPGTVTRLMNAGLSVVTVSYRWAYRDHEAALDAPRPNDEGTVHDQNGTRLDYILRDCARAIQFVRYKAPEWGLDASKIAVFGGSAGAGCATWMGGVEDLAEPEHADPVLRQSTRVQVVGHLSGQPTYAWSRWPALLNMPADFVLDYIETEAVRLTQMSLDDASSTEVGRGLEYVLDYYEHMGPGDAAFFTMNLSPDLDETMITARTEVIHHPRGHVALYERCVAGGLDCALRTVNRDEGANRDLNSFIVRVLAP